MEAFCYLYHKKLSLKDYRMYFYTMKNVVYLLFLAFLFTMCKSTKAGQATAKTSRAEPTVQYRDDFTAAKAAERNALLKKLNASLPQYSVLIFTKGYKGEKVTAKNTSGKLYEGYPISNLKTGIAYAIRIANEMDTYITEDFTKNELTIPAAEAKKHKYIYVMKEPGKRNPFTVTYSNTLRPLE